MKRILIVLLVIMVILCMGADSEVGTIQRGSSGSNVIAIQKKLCSMNYLSEKYVTGNFDDMTELAVLAFQLDHEITPTGVADSETQQAITVSMKTNGDSHTTGNKNTGIGFAIAGCAVIGWVIYRRKTVGIRQNKRELKHIRKQQLAQIREELMHAEVEKMSGIEYERYCGKILLNKGIARRIEFTPASNDYGADIIAYFRDGSKVVIQCKRYQGKVSNSAVQEVVAAVSHYKADRAMIITNSTLTQNAQVLANDNGVTVMQIR